MAFRQGPGLRVGPRGREREEVGFGLVLDDGWVVLMVEHGDNSVHE